MKESVELTPQVENKNGHPKGPSMLPSATSITDKAFKDIIPLIFRFLDHSALHVVRRVGKQWLQLVDQLPYNKQLVTWAGSPLWRSLPAMSSDGDILGYLENSVLLYQVGTDEQEDFRTLTAFCATFQRYFPGYSSYPCGQKMTAIYLEQRAKFILETVQQHNPKPESESHQTLHSFLHHQGNAHPGAHPGGNQSRPKERQQH